MEAEVRWPSCEMNSCPARLIGSMVFEVEREKEMGFRNFTVFYYHYYYRHQTLLLLEWNALFIDTTQEAANSKQVCFIVLH